MAGEVSLQSKYERLCAEFVKLRKKHNEYKDDVNKQIVELKKCNKEKSDRLSELERQYEAFKLRLNAVPEQLDEASGVLFADTLEKGVSANSSINQNDSSILAYYDKACQTASSASMQYDSSASERAIQNLTNSLHQWLDALSSHSHEVRLSESHSLLLKRISELEFEVSTLQADLQCERRQGVANNEEAYVQPDAANDQVSISPTARRVPLSERDTFMVEFLRSRVESSMEQAQFATSIASFLHDELRAVVPHLSSLAWELHESRATVQRLMEELENLKLSTSKQNDAMAQHMVNLTEELQHWRCSSRNHPVSTTITDTETAQPKKNSRLNVLKR